MPQPNAIEKIPDVEKKEPEKILTEEESEQQYTDNQSKKFFDEDKEDNEILEINFD